MKYFFKISRFGLIVASILKAITTLRERIESQKDISEHDIKKILFYERKTLMWNKTVRRYQIIIVAMYIGLYISFASFFLSNIIIFSDIISYITALVSITGTTIFILILSISQYIKEVHLQRLQIIHSHLMLMCAQYNIEPSFILEDDENEYREMLELLDTLELQRKKEKLIKKIHKKTLKK
ncbi:MAG: hypothetical protein ACMXYB_03385 [Candidatus Woesearchaeota archaeon]